MKRKVELFDDAASDEDNQLKINKNYATNYEVWRRKEEINKCKTRYGDVDGSEDETSSSSDDEDVDDLKVFDSQFLQTLSCLKNNDPKIYDKNVQFFNDDDTEKEQATTSGENKFKTKKEKPLTLRDYEMKNILNQNQEEGEEVSQETTINSHYEKIKKQKNAFKDALENDAEIDDCFQKRTTAPIEQADDECIKFLKGKEKVSIDKKVESELKPLKDYWSNPNLDSGEKFLRDYILNKRFLDNQDSNYVPTYDEVIHDSDEGLSEDENAIVQQEEFETKYNYRFEEPDKEFIKRYPRTMENSVRKKDERRKIKRVEVRERKEQEKLQKREELQRLKALKLKEIEEKIEKIKEVTGNKDMEFNMNDLDEDFDPEEHDKKMQKMFNDDFYTEEELQKPEFPDLDEELGIENWDKWKGPEEGDDDNEDDNGPHCEDKDFIMDCDYDPSASTSDELIESTKGRKKRRRKSKFAEVVSQKKPAFNPDEKTYEEYMEEYYKLDYEDLIGDIPCRFKYRKVVPNSFGLSVEEILSAKDKELNRWCSLKKAVQIRPDNVEKYEQIAYAKKGQNEALKRKIFLSLYANPDESETPTTSAAAAAAATTSTVTNEKKKSKSNVESLGHNQVKKKKHLNESKDKFKKQRKKAVTDEDMQISDERLKAYGIRPKKFKNKLKYGNKNK